MLPKSPAVRSDEQIKKFVVDQLTWDSRVDASGIAVTVLDGEVTLAGTVPGYPTRAAAIADAWAVGGVRQVKDQLRIATSALGERPSDDEVHGAVEGALKFDVEIDHATMEVSVQSGVVTLRGSVDALWKRDRAEQLAAAIQGVLDVRNELTVVRTEDLVDQTIAADITRALERDALTNAVDITVEVADGNVILSGVVPAGAVRDRAYLAAAHTRGVLAVRNEITVAAP